MALDNSLLFYFIGDALRSYSENFGIINKDNPVRFQLNEQLYSVNVSYVHDSGNTRPNEDERRIQLARRLIDEQLSRQQNGDRVAFIGFFETGDTFVAWDPWHVFSLQAETQVSVYARQSQQQAVLKDWAAVHQFASKGLGRQSFAIALPVSALGFYLENIEHFHKLPTVDSIRNLVAIHTAAISGAGLGLKDEVSVEVNGVREKFTFERTAYPRDPRFTQQVLEAYNKTCCICGRQLNIIQAAHIIPHNLDDSPNDVTNGLGLCVEHHKFYDDALLLPGPGYQLVFNTDRANYLRETSQDKGLKEISEYHGKPFTVPDDPAKCPQEEYLQRGLKIRMGS